MERMILASVGTKGDVGPAIALGARLAETREIILVAPPENKGAAERAGLRFLPLGEDFSGVVAKGDLGLYREQIGLQFSAYKGEFERADAILGFSLFFAASSWAEATGARSAQVFYTPQVFRSRLLGPPTSKRARSSSLAIRLERKAQGAQDDFILKSTINAGRASLGLKALRHACEAREGSTQVLAVDEELASLPRDVRGVRQAHYWHRGSGLALDETTERFLDGGKAPFLITLGNVAGAVRGSLDLMRRAAAGLRAEGERAIIVHPEAPESPRIEEGRLEARFLPFDPLLPRCRAIAHQGGIGTLFAAALAGTPQLALPCMLDQYFWARRIAALGLGSEEKGPLALAEPDFPSRLVALGGEPSAKAASLALATRLSSAAREAALRAKIEELFAGGM